MQVAAWNSPETVRCALTVLKDMCHERCACKKCGDCTGLLCSCIGRCVTPWLFDKDKGAMDAQAFLQVVDRVDACHGSDTLRLAVSESSVW